MARPCSLPCTCLLACTQLDKLRTIIENMLASSSTLLSMSMAPHKALTPLAPGQIDPEATCPACSLDLSHQVSTLVQRYEQLQDMVSSLAVSRASKRAKLQSQVIPTSLPPGTAAHGLWAEPQPGGSWRGCHWQGPQGRAMFSMVEPFRDPRSVRDPSRASRRGRQQS